MRLQKTVFWIAIFTIGPFVAESQERPSLERLEAAICAKADADGDTYRPFVCDPRCDCFDSMLQPFATVTSCSEAAPGDFTVMGILQGGACIDRCVGFVVPGGISTCTSGPPIFTGDCSVAEPSCPAGYTCVFAFGHCGLASSTCADDSDCNTPVECDSSSFAECSVLDPDCPVVGETCEEVGPSTFACVLSCATDSDCEAAFSVDLNNVGGPDSGAVALCVVPPFASAPVNANDALECLAEAGTLLGGTCSSVCGNGVVGPGEQCDDGNVDAGDGCAPDCTTE